MSKSHGFARRIGKQPLRPSHQKQKEIDMSSQELILTDQTYMPAMSIGQAAARFNTLVEFVQTVMRADVDYGIVPGTTKPTLLKPGAEKLTTLFGLTTRFVVVEKTEDWTGEGHGGEPFFYYWYRCQLWRGERLIAEADGSCNSKEAKYRWREAKRVCPVCNQAAIIKGKAEYGGGWLCFKKQGGCGAKYADGDQAIEGQPAGRVPNPDICDQVNTLQKMSQKRAMIAAVLIGVNASEFFTQDVEDIQMVGNGSSYTPPVQVVDTKTGEVFGPRPQEDCEGERTLLKQLRDELKAAGGTPRPFSQKQVLAMSCEQIRAEIDTTGAALDVLKRPATDLRDEWDAIDATEANR